MENGLEAAARGTFTLNLTGLCHYIPLGSASGGVYRDGVMVVLPAADNHTAKVEKVVSERARPDERLSVGIYRGVVELIVSTLTPATPGVEVTNEIEGIYGAIPLATIDRDLADQNGTILTPRPGSSFVRARLRLANGSLRPYIRRQSAIGHWRLPPTGDVIRVSRGMELTVPDATQVVIRAEKLVRGIREETIPIDAGGLTLELSNSCGRVAQEQIDGDFEHHYTMIQEAMFRFLKEGHYPFRLPELTAKSWPIIEREIQKLLDIPQRTDAEERKLRRLQKELEILSTALGSGCNCLGATGLARPLPT